jgi:hypothetical protein
MATGNEQFKQALEAFKGTRIKDKKMGRPANLQKRS